MATPTPPAPPVGPDTLVTIKILQNESVNRRVKLPLRDLGARVFPQKIRQLLAIPPTHVLTLERYSDSVASYVLLDSENLTVYKQLYRAAKAKLKLRIKATSYPEVNPEPVATPIPSPIPELPSQKDPKDSSPRYSYLETVLSSPLNAPQKEAEAEAEAEAPQPVQEFPQPGASTMTLPCGRPRPTFPLRFPENDSAAGSFCIDCNNCRKGIPAEHFHCGICDDGDYDLCPACVNAGVTCPGQNHWLLKRLVQNGVVINSTTETIAPKRTASEETLVQETLVQPVAEKEVEPKAEETTPTPVLEVNCDAEERTCNACFREFSKSKMVTCDDCEDYDLCVGCLLKNTHGHHPGHSFSIISEVHFCLKAMVQSRCRPGHHRHHAATCDGCNKRIIGVRHKCLACPDWDYCWSCIKNADETHPRHRFVPIYDVIAEPLPSREVHHNIYCDGPLCRNNPAASWIVGPRYKCSICHDTDFCAACEALPTNPHNRTHPLIKFQTSVRNVSVSTLGDDGFGGHPFVMGDHNAMPAYEVPTPTTAPTTEPTPVPPEVATEKQDSKSEEQFTEAPQVAEKAEPLESVMEDHGAYFMRDTIPDGTSMSPGHVFKQTWTLYNPGPLAWPIGTSIRYVGGDAMFNVDTNHPSSAQELTMAMSSDELTSPVGPAESADFTVTLKSPQRTGTSISYWRLKLPNGTPFGHKLWCDIKVAEELPVESSLTAPLSESNMIFPKLEKESPLSSTHEAMSETAPSAPPLSSADEQEILEDVESLALEDVSDDNGFLTDEEYDILDASDRESLHGKNA
ncbi:hypothetical protein BGW36DRAFT_309699 [Talaromyces proteolyticus]|uniref:ZZ-type domain-containing protein n=1 Tax=Talaromyces proteolyticus TaxID=1131652 RepID=A0AAD4PRG6_9EURO|nr:uncharacterized protein BGW36DRAFT_309699 [Talaromyces proteolyticus]KAH8688831.1 hypothetical protein BGW36DRAFT_309699 [Talaromyces proteolyticus]